MSKDKGNGLNARDQGVLDLLTEHRVATAEHIARVEFTNAKRAGECLLRLTKRDILARWRPYLRPGSAPYYYTVGPLGATINAVAAGAPAPRSGDIKERLFRLRHSPRLGHILGVVEFFTLLHASARALPYAELAEWWSERRTAPECFGIVQPDGYGRWVEHTPDGLRELRFLYEHDRGTEQIATLLGKLDRYTRLMTERPGIDLPVLIELPNRVREANLHQHMSRRQCQGRQRYVIVATTNTRAIRAAGDDPAGPVWWLAGISGTRHRLINLPHGTTRTAGAPR
jgi:hypothetical protein